MSDHTRGVRLRESGHRWRRCIGEQKWQIYQQLEFEACYIQLLNLLHQKWNDSQILYAVAQELVGVQIGIFLYIFFHILLCFTSVSLNRESKHNQWLGVTVKSQGIGGKVVVSKDLQLMKTSAQQIQNLDIKVGQ